MAKATVDFTDNRGRRHSTADSATVSDLAALFGGMEGLATGIARTILEQRGRIEQIFAEHDEITGAVRKERA